MNCVICRHGQTKAGTATLTVVRGAMTLVVKNVPAEVCDNCGEEYIDEAAFARLEALADEALQSGVQVEVREYPSAAA
jgi:YgiT-type zinc finger domain-containing protein